jgi:hypothetical protein
MQMLTSWLLWSECVCSTWLPVDSWMQLVLWECIWLLATWLPWTAVWQYSCWPVMFDKAAVDNGAVGQLCLTRWWGTTELLASDV